MKTKIIFLTMLICLLFPFFQASAVSDATWTNIYNRLEALENKTASQEQEIKDLKLVCSSQGQPSQGINMESRVNLLEVRLGQIEKMYNELNEKLTNFLKTIISYLIKR